MYNGSSALLRAGVPGLGQQAVLQPPEETVKLWTKAIETPDTLTDDDRTKILNRWPNDESDDLCKSRCGLTLAGLLEKAIQTPSALSLDECNIIRFGVRKTAGEWYSSSNVLDWPADLRTKRRKAFELAENDRDRRARENADAAGNRIRDEIHKAHQRLSHDDRTNIRWSNKISWTKELWELHEPDWGFVLLRTSFDDDEAWEVFKTQFTDAAMTALWLVKDSERVRAKWRIEWIEDRTLSGANLAQLCW